MSAAPPAGARSARLPRPPRISESSQHFVNIMVYGRPGVGKCLGRDTPVLMFDGTMKPVQEVVPDDLLMGPDSLPRRVLSTCCGRDALYQVVPVKGDPYVVNADHILSLVDLDHDRKIVNLSVTDYLSRSAHAKAKLKGYRVGVDFGEQPVELHPYFLGIWLGDGRATTPEITNEDAEVIAWLRKFAVDSGLLLSSNRFGDRALTHRLNTGRNSNANPVFDKLRHYELIDNKHIPLAYKANSRVIRLQLLAGLLDSDGSLENNCYSITLKDRGLAEDVLFLTRSLGYAAYLKECKKTCTNTGSIGTYQRIIISGDVSEIPVQIAHKKASRRRQIKDPLVTGISIEPVGEGEYFGFVIDGDRRFLLGDFTATHNTVFGATGPGPVFYIDCDDGLLSVERPLPELIKDLNLNPDELYSRPIRSFEQMTGIIRQLGQELRTEPGFWGTVVLDNLTELQRILMSELLGRSDPPRQVPEFRDWGIILTQMQGIVRAVKALPCHTVFIAHEADKEVAGSIPNTKVIEIAPALSGQIQRELPGYVDIVARYVLLEREKRKPDGTVQIETVRRLRCRPQVGNVSVIAKNRGGRLEDWEVPHFSKMIEKIISR